MLIKLLILAMLGIMFLLIFAIIDWLLQFVIDRKTLRARLKQGKGEIKGAESSKGLGHSNDVGHRKEMGLGQGKAAGTDAFTIEAGRSSHRLSALRTDMLIAALNKHMNQLIHSLQLPLKGDYLLTLLISLAIGGLLLGYWVFGTIQGMLLSAGMIGLLPYLVLRLLLVHRRLEAQIDFLPALEAFYQCYLITGERQIKVALARLIEEKRMTGGMKRVFEQLYRNLSVLERDEDSLQLFAHALGHIWADYFVQMLNVAMNEGVSISNSLRELIGDMRASRRANEQERHRLLEIRIANFTPILFLALFVGINFYYNREQSIHYYFYDAGGRELLLHMTVMIFLSFLMGLYLSRKKL